MPLRSFWWEHEADTDDLEAVARDVLGTARGIEEAQKGQHELNLRHARLYSNMASIDFGPRARPDVWKSHGRVTENVIQSVCDTAVSIIAKNRPRVVFLTDHGIWSEQRRAKLLEQFVTGIFQSCAMYDECVRVFRDAVVFGTGALKLYHDGDRICAERVLIDEIVVDEHEARSGDPRTIYQRKFVNRHVLAHLYPDHAEAIERAAADTDARQYTSWTMTESHQVPVVEAWHLPSGAKSRDGRHAIVVPSAALVWEEWRDDGYPFEFYRWSEPLAGFYGQGLAEQLTGIQLRINKLNRFIERAQDLIAVPRVAVPIGSGVLKAHINNEIGALIPFRGNKAPVWFTPQAVGPEIYAYKEQLKGSAYEMAGISRLSAQSALPSSVRLDSSLAVREFNDIETQRFAIQAQAYEQLFLRAARHVVAMAAEVYGKRGGEVTYAARDAISRIDWSEVDLEADRYVMSVEASSLLSRTPAGRKRDVIDMMQSGLVDQPEARRLLGHPDLERSTDLATAAIEDIEAVIEAMLYKGEYFPPEPYQDLVGGIARVQQAYLKARREGAPEDALQLLRDWIDQAQDTLERASAAVAPPTLPPVAEAPPVDEQQLPPEMMQ